MGVNASLQEPPRSVARDKTIPASLREKLLGLDYRVRKLLGRYDRDASDRLDDQSDNEDDGKHHAAIYHNQRVPESLFRMRVAPTGFRINLDAVRKTLEVKNECGNGDECGNDEWTPVGSDDGGSSDDENESHVGSDDSGSSDDKNEYRQSTTHAVILEPPAVQIPLDGGKIPPVKVTFGFSVEKVILTKRISTKSGALNGGTKLSVQLQMQVETDNTSQWHAPGCAAFARSTSFYVDAEAEGEGHLVEPKRWWDEGEHRRQGSRQPLDKKVLRPIQRYADVVESGHTILDLQNCRPVPIQNLNKFEPWRVAGASRRSAESVWALLGGSRRGFATPFGRRRLARREGHLEKVMSCQDVAHKIAEFVLEAVEYEFEAEIFFGIGLANY